MQEVDDFNDVDIEIVEIDTKDDIIDLEKNMVSYIFNIYEGPLFCFKIFKFKDNTGGFILNIHHLISDSWSSGIVAKEIIKAYNTLSNGEIPEKSSDLCYTNYIYSEKEYINSDKFTKDKEYWNSIFDTIPEQATIPSSIQDASNDFSPKANRKMFSIDSNEMDKINEYCRTNNISAFNFFMAVYAIYIGRVSGLDDFVIGTPILNRTNFKEKNTTGMFINTAPLRFLIDNNLDFKSFVSNIAKDSLGMLRHQKYYYQSILEDLRKKDSSLPGLYNILISYQVTKTCVDEGLSYKTRWTSNGNTANDIEIHLSDMNDAGSLDVAYDYKVSKYTDEDIEATHARIMYVINQILTNKNINLSDIEIVTPDEKDEILYKFNKTNKKFEYKNSIIEMLEDVASKFPNKVAVETKGETITYSELLEKVNMLSNYLINNIDLNSNSNIGIFTNRNIETIIGILAILKIDCTYVPIDSQYPIDRIKYMIETSKINTILLTNNGLRDKINDTTLNFVSINFDVYSKESCILKKHFNYDMNNNLYIVFTSGSTGKPKGITLSHKNMMNLILFEKNYTDIFDNKYAHKVLQFATMSFDVSYQEIFSSLLTGSTLVLVSDEIRKNMNSLSNYIIEKNIDTLFIPPAYLRIIVEDDDNINKLTSCIKNIITAGEALVITDGINKLLTSGVNIHNHYGPAETHVATTYTLENSYSKSNVPIGYPISNTSIYILDKMNNLCPINTIGQIAISGNCVGNGYFSNESLTNEKFITNKFDNNNKLYLTGDLGFFDNTGCIHYIGRSDFQVKINGFRIELGEIDKTIMQLPAIKSVVSVVQENNSKKHIVTYYTCKNVIDNSEIISFLKSHLPNYMIPAKLVKLDVLPINANGKIDKKQLKPVDLTCTDEYIEPSTTTEIKLQKIWIDMFHTSKIGSNYDFFDIGGDSLLAIKLCSIVLEKLNVDINVSDIFSHSVLSDLAKHIDLITKRADTFTIKKCKKEEFYSLSSAQSRIYFASKMDENSLVYNIPGGLLVNSILDKNRIINAFNQLIDLHESFRTCFKIIDNEPKQVVLDNIDFNIEFHNDTEDNTKQIVNSFPKPFDLSCAPLLRVCVYFLDNKKTLILLDSHHIILDGTSLNILIRDFCKLYNEEKVNISELNYIDYSVWENDYLNSENTKTLENYWVNKFKDSEIPTINLPYDFPMPATPSFVGNKISYKLPKETFDSLSSITKSTGTSNYMVFLTAFYILLYKYTSQENIIVGSPIANRISNDLQNIVGMFVNNIALNNYIDSNKTFSEFLNSTKNLVLEALNNQPYPYDLLTKKLNLNGQNLFDVMLTYQNTEKDNFSLDGKPIEIIEANANISKFNLSLEIVPDTYTLNLEYRTDLFKDNTANAILEHYVNILKNIDTNLNKKISDISILSEEERNRILYDFNNTKMDYPSDKTIAELFEEQVAKTPDNIAVVFEDKKLTYRELNEKANRLSRFLIANNVMPNDIVCLLLNKSLESIIAIIAILKIGAVYLPIDVDYPDDRIDYIIRDSKSKILLTTENYIHKSNNTIQSLCIELDNFIYSQYDCNNINCKDIYPDSLAYIMYTSGSTGNPKGVMVKHKNIIRLIKNNRFIIFGNTERILQTGSIVFDACTFEIFGALLNGFELYVIRKEELLDAQLLEKYLVNNKITILWLTAPLFNQLCEEKPSMFRNVKILLTGGDVLSPKHINLVRKTNPNLTVINGYGPTENTTFSCCFTIDKMYKDSIPIGKPISNSTAYIVSSSSQLNPIGVPGELWVGGDGVAKGYLNNEKLSNDKFIQNPFGDGIIYKTGDLVKWLPDGTIDFMGRIDNQVKIRGFRVELGEINSKISTFPSIRECFTIVNELKGEKTICSYIVGDKKIDIQELKQFLKRNLPTYMIPTYFMQLDKLPINTNGKVDRKALPTNFKSTNNKDKIKLPTNETEKILLDIYKKLLSFDNIGIDEDFFELGGNSLLAIKLQVEAISNNIQIKYSDIFEHRTVEELAKCIDKKDNAYIVNSIDYEKYNVLLQKNRITPNMKISSTPIGNVLLTGFTGFLGAHVLDSFIKEETGTIYCLIRGKNNMTPKDRLENVLHFYFDFKYDKYIGTRIKLIDGDITLPNLGLNTIDYNILGTNVNTVIHCAALVKHYGSYKEFESINILGTKTVINFAKQYDLRLLHVSTISVSGNNLAEGANIDNNFKEEMLFNETNFYIGQNLKNFYVRSKFEAEKLVLDAILDGLQACILRMGNLTSRFSEGKFQQNHFENAFVNRLKSFLQIGVFPESLLNLYCEFTPIDYCGDAIINIARHFNKDYTVFHLLNEKHVYLDRLFEMLNKIGININLVSDDEFTEIIQLMLNEPEKQNYLEGIINDLNSDRKLVYKSDVKIESDFTKEFLYNIGFEWPHIDINYIRNYFNYLANIGYFNIN